MKTNSLTSQKNTKPQIQDQKKMNQRPENKDNLDSREGEEQVSKGHDITHNKKEKHNKPKKHK